MRCGLWQRLVGHVHGGAGDGADGLAGRLLDGAVDDGVQLDGLIGARLGGNVLKQVARLALEHFANALHGGETHGLDVTATHARNVHRRDVDALGKLVAITRSRRGIIGITAPLHGFVAELLEQRSISKYCRK